MRIHATLDLAISGRRSLPLAALFAMAMTFAPAAGAQTAQSWAPSGALATWGYGHNVAVYGAGLNWDSLLRSAWLKAHGLDTRLVAQIAYWQGRDHESSHRSLWDLSLTPMLRFMPWPEQPLRFFAEAGIGIRFLSATRINDDRLFGSSFQFGEQAGAGIAFGARGQYEFGVYVQHVSNARIKEPNDGLTYYGGVLRAAFD